MVFLRNERRTIITLIIKVLGFSAVWKNSNMVLLCAHGFDVFLVIGIFATSLMCLEISFHVVWGRFGMI